MLTLTCDLSADLSSVIIGTTQKVEFVISIAEEVLNTVHSFRVGIDRELWNRRIHTPNLQITPRTSKYS